MSHMGYASAGLLLWLEAEETDLNGKESTMLEADVENKTLFGSEPRFNSHVYSAMKDLWKTGALRKEYWPCDVEMKVLEGADNYVVIKETPILIRGWVYKQRA